MDIVYMGSPYLRPYVLALTRNAARVTHHFNANSDFLKGYYFEDIPRPGVVKNEHGQAVVEADVRLFREPDLFNDPPDDYDYREDEADGQDGADQRVPVKDSAGAF